MSIGEINFDLNFNGNINSVSNTAVFLNEYEQARAYTTLPSSNRANLRRFRAEATFPSNVLNFANLSLNKENANLSLEYYNKKIADLSRDNPFFEIEFVGLLYKKLALHCYLEQTAQAAICLQELNGMENFEDNEEEIEWIEGDLCHDLLDLAVTHNFDSHKILELGRNDNPVFLLLLKAKGIPLPEPEFLPSHDSDLERALASQDYQKAITLIDHDLQKNQYINPSDRAEALLTRGFCKAMLGDYEGALKDYPFDEEDLPSVNWDETYIVRGLTHYLKGDLEKARKDLWLPYKEEMTIGDLLNSFLGSEKDLSGFFMKQILSL